MTTIYKYPVEIADEFWVEMPTGARILTVQVQNGEPFIWAQVETTAPYEPRGFRVVGTGHPMSDAEMGMPYVGTFQLEGGALVFHLFTSP